MFATGARLAASRCLRQLRGLDHGAQAAGADVDSLFHAVDDQDARLDVRLEETVGSPLGEAHIMAELGRLSANITLTGHVTYPPRKMNRFFSVDVAVTEPRVETRRSQRSARVTAKVSTRAKNEASIVARVAESGGRWGPHLTAMDLARGNRLRTRMEKVSAVGTTLDLARLRRGP